MEMNSHAVVLEVVGRTQSKVGKPWVLGSWGGSVEVDVVQDIMLDEVTIQTQGCIVWLRIWRNLGQSVTAVGGKRKCIQVHGNANVLHRQN